MAEERPYSLLIRLGVILVPMLAGILFWSYYRAPAAGVDRQQPAAAVPAPAAASIPDPPAADPTVPAATPAAAPVAAGPAPSAAAFADPEAGGFRGTGAGSRPAAPPGSAGTQAPPRAPTPAATTERRERSKGRDARKQEASSVHRTIEKLDKQIGRKLSICSGC